jgi:hypothetical protein
MPRPSPYPPLELDLDDISPSGLRPAQEPVRPEPEAADASSDKRNTVPPAFDLEEFAKEVMADGPEGGPIPGLPDPPDSEVRAVSHTSKTGPPPPQSLYPEKSAIKKSSASSLHQELDELLACRDHRAALVVAEQILADEPDDIRAKAGVLRCHGALEEMYASRLGSLERIPRVVIPREEIPTLALDHISGFILALIDGTCTLDTILDMASMPRLDALRVLHELVQHGTVTLD